jgi:predicted DNA-binding transcriptional regulator AlpA
MKRTLTIDEAAAVLGISRRTVYNPTTGFARAPYTSNRTASAGAC